MGRFSWMRGTQPEPEPPEAEMVEPEPEEEEPEVEDEIVEPPNYEEGEWWQVVVTMLGGGRNKHQYTFDFGFEESYNDMKKEALELADKIMPNYGSPSYPWVSETGTTRIKREHIVSVVVNKRDRTNHPWS